MSLRLHEPFERAAAASAERVAVVDPGRGAEVQYGPLDELVDALAKDLARLGVSRGQRVGLHASKSIPALAAILATLKAGGAYVPVDAQGPPRRAAQILMDCDVRAIITERGHIEVLRASWDDELGVVDSDAATAASRFGSEIVMLTTGRGEPSEIQDLAYILYTSGSTGKPKGVMHTHSSARSFVDWCEEAFAPIPEDRFSSHAPLHFDLSILDLFVPLGCGAAVVLVGEEQAKNPLGLASLISENRITVWYSTPSVLRMLVDHGRLAHHPASHLRLVLFAGEVFPPGQLRRLQQAWPGRRYFNLYGPTETNVCTYYEVVGEVPPDRVEPYPIGKAIPPDRVMVLGPRGTASPGEEGELLVQGRTVMSGYWNRPELDAAVFHVDDEGEKWYRTGDLVREDGNGDLLFLGRRDRMIKRRGYRVELGEIEAALHGHPHVREAAVVSASDPSEGVRVRAFVSWTGSAPASTIELKRFCAENLPLYMIPDSFSFLERLPKTSTNKTDYLRLAELDA